MDGSDAETAHRVCSVDDLAADGAVVEDVDGARVAVFVIDDEVYALDGVCPHQGGPLGDGKVVDGCVHCPWHGWQFDVETGEHVHGKADATSYPVVVEDDEVYVTF